MVLLLTYTNWYNSLEDFKEIHGRHDCLVTLGYCWYARVCREQFVGAADHAAFRP